MTTMLQPVVGETAATLLVDTTRLSPDLTASYLEHHALLPVRHDNGHLLVATWFDHPDEQALDDLRLIAGVDIELVQLPEAEIRHAIQRFTWNCRRMRPSASWRQPRLP